MPRKPVPPSLIGGPYTAPPCEPGSSLVCERRGRLDVAGLTDAPIPWPVVAGIGGRRPSLILCGDLVRAVRTETAAAVAHHWGVSRWAVQDWRRALSVERFNEGTKRRWSELAPSKFTTELRRAGGKAGGKGRPAKRMPG